MIYNDPKDYRDYREQYAPFFSKGAIILGLFFWCDISTSNISSPRPPATGRPPSLSSSGFSVAKPLRAADIHETFIQMTVFFLQNGCNNFGRIFVALLRF